MALRIIAINMMLFAATATTTIALAATAGRRTEMLIATASAAVPGTAA